MKHKQDLDSLVVKFHDSQVKMLNSEQEKQAFAKLLLPKQAQSNDTLINEQNMIIQQLKLKIIVLEQEIMNTSDKNDSMWIVEYFLPFHET
jgi:hypothetical protein